jgi:type II secretory ATPase GspE/PulE/Tfp pilus assembly ATPase PilB-like protein
MRRRLEVLRELAKDNGMVTLFASCRKLVESGLTSMQELMSLNAQ